MSAMRAPADLMGGVAAENVVPPVGKTKAGVRGEGTAEAPTTKELPTSKERATGASVSNVSAAER